MSGWETSSTSQTDSNDKTITLTCPTAGKKVLSGGFALTAGSPADLSKLAAAENFPPATDQWRVKAIETANVVGSWTLTVYIICGSA